VSPQPAALADPGRLLAAWEAAAAAPPVARAAVLADVAGVVPDLDTALDLPLAEQAWRLARFYAESFGEAVDGTLSCGTCGAVVEVRLPLSAFDPPGGSTTASVPLDKGSVVVRALTTRDLVEAAADVDPADALLRRSVTGPDGRPVAQAGITGPERAAIDAAAEALAGGAALVVRSSCPECGSDLAAPVDVPTLLWDRITAIAPAILAEVAELAVAFAWSESDVLALSAVRRAAYLDLARGGRT
jgi:hypothetical protein